MYTVGLVSPLVIFILFNPDVSSIAFGTDLNTGNNNSLFDYRKSLLHHYSWPNAESNFRRKYKKNKAAKNINFAKHFQRYHKKHPVDEMVDGEMDPDQYRFFVYIYAEDEYVKRPGIIIDQYWVMTAYDGMESPDFEAAVIINYRATNSSNKFKTMGLGMNIAETYYSNQVTRGFGISLIKVRRPFDIKIWEVANLPNKYHKFNVSRTIYTFTAMANGRGYYNYVKLHACNFKTDDRFRNINRPYALICTKGAITRVCDTNIYRTYQGLPLVESGLIIGILIYMKCPTTDDAVSVYVQTRSSIGWILKILYEVKEKTARVKYYKRRRRRRPAHGYTVRNL